MKKNEKYCKDCCDCTIDCETCLIRQELEQLNNLYKQNDNNDNFLRNLKERMLEDNDYKYLIYQG